VNGKPFFLHGGQQAAIARKDERNNKKKDRLLLSLIRSSYKFQHKIDNIE